MCSLAISVYIASVHVCFGVFVAVRVVIFVVGGVVAVVALWCGVSWWSCWRGGHGVKMAGKDKCVYICTA